MGRLKKLLHHGPIDDPMGIAAVKPIDELGAYIAGQ